MNVHWARVTGATAVALLVMALSVGGAAEAASAADHQSEMKAREAFAAGRYDEALQLFAKLYAETLHPVYLRNIGRCHQKMREPDKAIDAFRDYLAKSKKLPADERTEIQGYIKEMEALRDEQARAAAPPVVPPPSPPPALPPAPSPAASDPMMLTANGSASKPAGEAPVYKRWWFWTAIGAVVVGGVVTAVVLSSGTSRPACSSAITGGCQ